MHRANHSLRLLLIMLLGLLLSGCATLRPEPPQVQLASLQLNDLSLSHANFLATLSLYNPNRTTLNVEGLEFSLFLDKIRIADGKTAKAFSIPAEQSGTAELRLAASFLEMIRLTQQIKNRDQVPFRIAGAVRIGGPGWLGVTVPINSEGTLPLADILDKLQTTPGNFRHHTN
jgi:LEA14-like dessication related protein